MAEFCLECWNRINGLDEPEDKYIISDIYELCEGCGELKRIIIIDKKSYYRYKLRKIFFPIVTIGKIFYILIRILLIPHTIYLFHKYKKLNKNKDD